MDSSPNYYMSFKGITPNEMNMLQQLSSDLSGNQKGYFYMIYSGKRKSPQDILLFTLIGLFGASGIQRFMIGEIGMGLLYLFTSGLCMIGTIVDIINHKSLAWEYNKKMLFESYKIASMGN
jgi:TM2 domain-containing membrane protein YozV